MRLVLGFKFKRQDGSHAQYERPSDGTRKRCVVTVDMGKRNGFSLELMKSMIRQSGFSRDEFCRGIPKSSPTLEQTNVEIS